MLRATKEPTGAPPLTSPLKLLLPSQASAPSEVHLHQPRLPSSGNLFSLYSVSSASVLRPQGHPAQIHPLMICVWLQRRPHPPPTGEGGGTVGDAEASWGSGEESEARGSPEPPAHQEPPGFPPTRDKGPSQLPLTGFQEISAWVDPRQDSATWAQGTLRPGRAIPGTQGPSPRRARRL